MKYRLVFWIYTGELLIIIRKPNLGILNHVPMISTALNIYSKIRFLLVKAINFNLSKFYGQRLDFTIQFILDNMIIIWEFED